MSIAKYGGVSWLKEKKSGGPSKLRTNKAPQSKGFAL